MLEEQRYIHGWTYKSDYNQPYLSHFLIIIAVNFIQLSELEMAYELIQNVLSCKELYYNPTIIKNYVEMAITFKEILENIINKKNYSHLLEQWNDIDKKLIVVNEIIIKNASNLLLSVIDNIDNLAICFIEVMNTCWNCGFMKDVVRFNQMLGWIYYNNKNYTDAIMCFMNAIKYKEEVARDKFLDFLIEIYRSLAVVYSALKNKVKVIEILQIIESAAFKDKFLFYAAIGEIYYLLNNFDEALKNIWKCIKMSKQKSFIHSYELSNLWLYLAEINTWKGDFMRAHKFICYAKSLLSILPITDPNKQKIYKAFGVFYLNSQRYEEALEYFKLMDNKCSEHEVLFTKLSMGIAYFWMRKFEIALICLSKAKKIMSAFTESYKNELFIVNAYIGELYNIIGRLKIAEKYFIAAFNFIHHYDVFKIDIFLKSQSFVFQYFYGKSDYEKCRVVFLRIKKILKNNDYLKFRKPYYFIQRAKLYIASNQINEAIICLKNAEKLLNINNILLSSQKSRKINYLDCISDYIELAILFNIFDEYRQKTQEILKYAEEVVSTKRRNDRFSKLAIYYCHRILYFKEHKWEETTRCSELSLDLYNQFKHSSRAVRDLKPSDVLLTKYLNFSE